MKKTIFFGLLSLISFGVLFAQNSIFILNIDTVNNVTASTVKVGGFVQSGIDSVKIRLQSRKTGLSSWKNYSLVTYGPNFNGNSLHTADSLESGTNYEFRFAIYNDTVMMDSSLVKTAKTKPLPQPPSITLLGVTPELPASRVRCAFSSVPYASYIFGRDASTGQVITDTVTVTGTSSNMSFAIIPNNPGDTIPEGFLVIQPLVAGMPARQSATTWAEFVAPSLVAPQLNSWSINYKGTDSVRATVAVTSSGNGGAVTISTWLIETGGTTQGYDDVIGSLATVSQGGLKSNTDYKLIAVANSSSGTDSSETNFTTKNVNSPSISVSNTQQTKTSVSFDINVNKNGSWVLSEIDSLVAVRNGVVIPLSPNATSANITGLDPGTMQTIKLYCVNKAGLKSNILTFSITTDAPLKANIPQWGTLMAQTPSRVDLRNITYSVISGDAAQIFFLRQLDGLSIWDTIWDQSGLTGSGTITLSDEGLLGGTKLWYRIGLKSSDGDIAINSLKKSVVTIAAESPDIYQVDIKNVSSSTIEFSVPGNGNGTLSSLKVELLTSGGSVLKTLTINVGTASFNHQGVFTGLDPATAYVIKAQVFGPGSSQSAPVSKTVTTLGSTGISDISENETEKIVPAFSLIGQKIGQGTKKQLLQEFPGRPIIIEGKIYCSQ